MMRTKLIVFWLIAAIFLVLSSILVVDALLIGFSGNGYISEEGVTTLGNILFLLSMVMFWLIVIIKCRYCGKRQLFCSSSGFENSLPKNDQWWNIPTIVRGRSQFTCCNCSKEI